MPGKVKILQTCLPDYRLPLFERLLAVRTDVHMLCGRDYFTASLSLCTTPAPWRTFITNRFLLGGALLWQGGVLREAVEAEELIAEFNPRILSTWLILLRRKLAGKRTLFWGHLWGQHGPQWLARHLRHFMLQLADGMICYTRSQQEELDRMLPRYPTWAAGNSCVTREGCVAAEAPAQGGAITYVGRLIKDKKPALLLEAFAKALPQLPGDARLWLVGDGSELLGLKARVRELGLAGRVELPGHIADVAVLKGIYDQSLVAVSPGYVGLSAIQAMAFGVPMLVSRNEPHSPEIEACIEGQTAVFFDTDNSDSLAAKLIGFFVPDSPWREKRSRISRFIADNYTFDGMVDTFVSAIDPITAGHAIEGGGKTALDSGHARSPASVALVWAQFGPYHLARLRAMKRKLDADEVMGVEIGSRTSTYAWQREQGITTEVVTLFPGQTAEQVAAADIYRAALQVFRKRRVRTVFVPSYWPASSLAVLLAARTAGARIVMMNDTHAHTAKARGILAAIKRRLVLQFDAAFVAGAPQREYFAAMGLPARRIVTGYDVVDNDYFAGRARDARNDAASVRARQGLPPRYFLNVGRMVWKKNLETLIDAYARVKERMGHDCPALVLVGSGTTERTLRERCLGLGLSIYQVAGRSGDARSGVADVYFMGFRQVDELPDFFALADCFILPSREEEWGLVVNEAMASGLPVLVSNVAGCARDLVRDGQNGFCFDPFDANALAGYMELIARDLALARRMGGESQKKIADWGCERFASSAFQARDIAMGSKKTNIGDWANVA